MAEPTTSGPGRWRTIVLTMSLALNVLIIGVVAGSLLRADDDRPNRRSPPVGSEIGVGPLLQAMDPEDRRALGRAVYRDLRRGPERRGQMQSRLRETALLLRSDTLDEAALVELFEGHMETVVDRYARVQGVLAARLGDMTPAERAVIADRLDHFAEHGLPRPQGRKGPKPKRD